MTYVFALLFVVSIIANIATVVWYRRKMRFHNRVMQWLESKIPEVRLMLIEEARSSNPFQIGK